MKANANVIVDGAQDNPIPTDESLVSAVKAGDTEAFGQLYDRHHRRVRALVVSMTGRHAVDDLVQDCFLHAYRSLTTFRGDAAFSTWLHRIAVHTVISALRRPRRLVLAPAAVDRADSDAIDPELAAQGEELVTRLYELLDTMSPKRRVALTLFAVEGRSLQTVAELLGVPVSVVKSRIFFA